MESPYIFGRRSIQSRSSFRKPFNNSLTIDTARQSIQNKLNSLLTVHDKFEQLRLNLEDKGNFVEELMCEKSESSRVSTSNSQHSLRHPKGKPFLAKGSSINQIKIEAELRSKLSSKSWIVYDQHRNVILFEKGSSVKR